MIISRIKKIILGMVFLILIIGVWGETGGGAGGGIGAEQGLGQKLGAGIEIMAKELVGQEVPGPFKFLFGDERINIYIQLKSGGEEVIGLVTEGGRVKSFGLGKVEDNSLKVMVGERTLEEVQKAKEPGLALKEAWEEGKITYKAVGFWNKIKFGVLGAIAKMVAGFEKEEKEEKETVKEETVEESGEETGDEKTEVEDERTEIEDEKIEAGEGEERKIKEEEGIGEEEVGEKEVKEEEVGKMAGSGGITGAAVQAAEIRKNFPESHTVELVDGGFGVKEITIKAGDKVVWENVRENKNLNKALILGTQKCAKIKSGVFMPGQHFSWTFEKAGTCLIVDGIFTTEVMKVIVEK